MEKAEAELQAARDMIAALDLYEVKFKDMVSSRMEPSAYEDVSRLLEAVRDAKAVVFYYVVQESVEFLMTHSSLMGALWEMQLSDLRGTPSQFTGNIGALHDDHENSLDRLRNACEKLITQRTRDSRKPPAAPSAGL